MRGAISLGRLFGVLIEIHWTFLFIIVWAVYDGWRRGGTVSSALWTTALVLTIFVCVVLHELGHSLAARRYGIATKRITLLPIGGVASLERMPEEPRQELVVAMAGPAVNIVIAAILFPFVYPQLHVFADPEEAQVFFTTIRAENFLVYLFLTNIMLVLFNAIPAFPMDGGRVLRALLSFRLNRVRATQIAAYLGQMIAILFFFLGFFSNPFLILIGLFVFFGASGEYSMIRQLSGLQGHQVREAMMRNFTILQPDDDLHRVAEALLAGTERNFPVADENGTLTGILYHSAVLAAFQQKRNDLTVSDLMERDFTPLSPDEQLTEVYRLATERQDRFFPVLEYGKLIGTIDMDNINEFLLIQAGLEY